MSYEKKISQQYPGLIALILDDSGSMRDNLPGTSNPKYEWVERYTGIILDELLERSSEVRGDEVKIKPRYYQHITKYGSTTRLWNESHMDIETTIRHFTDSGNSLGLSGNLGGTDAKRAFKEAYDFLKGELLSEKYRVPLRFTVKAIFWPSSVDTLPWAEKVVSSNSRKVCF